MLNEKIRKLRKEKNITQEELGKRVGVSTSMIGMYETNARKPSYAVLLKIAEYFNTTTDYLIGNIEEVDDVVVKLELGHKIKNRRLDLGLTLEEIENKVGVSKGTVQNWESGYIKNMKRNNIALLAEALRVSPLWVMGIEDNTEKDGFSLEEEDPSTEELKQYFEKNYHKLAALPNDDKEKLIKMIDIYLD